MIEVFLQNFLCIFTLVAIHCNGEKAITVDNCNVIGTLTSVNIL